MVLGWTLKCVFEPTIPSLTKKGLSMADAVVGNGDGGGVVLVVTNLGTEPAHPEVGEVLGGLQPALAVEDLARSTDMRGAEDFHAQGESIGVDVPSMMQVAAVRSDTARERVKQLLDALSLDQLEVSMAEREKLQELVEDFTALFALDNSELGRTTVTSHSIESSPSEATVPASTLLTEKEGLRANTGDVSARSDSPFILSMG